ncbi:LOW QUALITY PROTEIN: peritrophin-55 [Drosophila obscura]|uniref:LOW QUALITY PROTEIN: peritrophin-55 n=1 Tax=Drosophila obscura TaxID=7282 RepID=UPI001BB1CF2D|nr:LOW QUALITY PROTEIN: peritrophin-55 [Drosophila obscura]
MKVFALTLLCLAAVAQAHVSYKLQCARGEIGIRWPSYHSNSEYFVCQGVYGSQLTIHCPPGEVFTFVLQQCASPAHYIPAPPIDVLPTAAPITMTVVEDAPPVMAAAPSLFEQHETAEHHEHHEHHEHQPEEEAVVLHPIPPTPAPEPPVVESAAKPVPMPHKVSGAKKPVVPVPAKKPVAAAKKPVAPIPSKAAKKPTPPSKAQKKTATA